MPVPKAALANAIKDRTAPPSAAEFARLLAYVRSAGLTLAQVQAIVGAGVGGRRRDAIARLLAAWLQQRPKG